MNSKQLASALLLSSLGFTNLASANVIYGTTNSGGTISDLVTIDLATGTTTFIGPTGIAINGLTYDSATGTLFASERGDGGLYTLNTSSGAASLVGAFNSGAGGCFSRNVLLTSNSSGDLFGWCDPSSDDLMSIDKNTGAATIVGDSGIGTGQHGLAFDVNDDLYLYQNSYYSLDTTTGAATLLGTFSGLAHHGDFNDANNLYYGIGASGPSGVLNVLDIVGGGGLVDTIQLDRSDLFTIAFSADGDPDPDPDPDPKPVPEPASLLMAGLGLIGLAYRRRR